MLYAQLLMPKFTRPGFLFGVTPEIFRYGDVGSLGLKIHGALRKSHDIVSVVRGLLSSSYGLH